MKPIFHTKFILQVLFITILTFAIINSSAQMNSPEFVLTYTVEQSNATTNTWFNSDYSESFNYTIPVGSEIEVKVADPSNESSLIDIKIGDLERLGISDNEAEGNLALGYWKVPGVFGFVSSRDWTAIDSELSSLNFTYYKMETDLQYQLNSMSINAIQFSFFDGFQNTTLLYNSENGLLLQAYSTFLGYELGFSLTTMTSSNHGTGHGNQSTTTDTEGENVPLSIIPVLSSIAAIGIILRKKH